MRCTALLALALILAGCSLRQHTELAQRAYDQTGKRVQDSQSAFERGISDHESRVSAQEVARPWLAGKALPLAREIALPAALRADVDTTLLFAGGALDIAAIARRITLATSIPVHVRPDAFLPRHAFMPRLSLAESPLQDADVEKDAARFELDSGPQPLAQLLDRLCARLGLWWRYENARIELYRSETRTFHVATLALNANVEASMGSASSQDAGFSGGSRTRLESGSSDAFNALRLRLEPFLSRAGVLAIDPAAGGSIVVTDSPDVLDRIAMFLEQENRAMTRRVRIIFEELTVQSHDHAELGLDWNLVFNRAASATGYSFSSGVTAAATAGARLAQTTPSGSDAVIKAIGETGKIVRRSSLPILTLNRRPVTHAVRTTFSYVDKVESLPGLPITGSNSGATAASQAQQTVGSLLTLIPDVQQDGQILLSIAYDNTVARPLKSITFGGRSNPLQLQQITIDGNGVIQQVALQPGQPVLISGFERSRNERGARRLNPGVPLLFGGHDKIDGQQVSTVVIITAQVEEGL